MPMFAVDLSLIVSVFLDEEKQVNGDAKGNLSSSIKSYDSFQT